MLVNDLASREYIPLEDIQCELAHVFVMTIRRSESLNRGNKMKSTTQNVVIIGASHAATEAIAGIAKSWLGRKNYAHRR